MDAQAEAIGLMKIQYMARQYIGSLRALIDPNALHGLATPQMPVYALGEIHPSALKRDAYFTARRLALEAENNVYSWLDPVNVKKAEKRIAKMKGEIKSLEFRLYSVFEPDGFLLEGAPDNSTPAASYVKRHPEISIVYLDEGNPYYISLQDFPEYDNLNAGEMSEFEELQKKREGIWIERIATRTMQRPILKVGSGHLKNKYGLIDALEKEGIGVI